MPTTTGPFTRSLAGKYVYKYQKWYRQKPPPFEAPLPYDMIFRTWSYGGSLSNSGVASALSYDPFSNPFLAEAHAKAYAKFKEAITSSANLAVNYAERKQAMDAIAKRTMQIYDFARHLKSFRFGKAAEALGLQVVTQTRTTVRFKRTEKSKKSSWDRAKAKAAAPTVGSEESPVSGQNKRFKSKPRYRAEDDTWEIRLKRRASAFGSNYLEYHFGWEPLMKDIDNLMEIYHSPLRNKHGWPVRGVGTSGGPQAPASHPNFAIGTYYAWGASVAIRARVKVQNVDLYRLEQLGLLNPAVLAWELVPFSFVVDWFTNVGDYLASFTDFIGLELTFPQTVYLSRNSEKVLYNWNGSLLLNGTYNLFSMRRTPGISGPALHVRSSKWPSATRGLTAISLLTGFFDTVQRRR
jgi:hypothetical protein